MERWSDVPKNRLRVREAVKIQREITNFLSCRFVRVVGRGDAGIDVLERPIPM